MAKSKKSASAAVRDSREAAGLKSTSIYVTAAEKALWRRLADARGESLKGALLAGLRALETDGEPTPAQALRVLARLVKGAA